MTKIWLNNSKAVVAANKVILCDVCPCGGTIDFLMSASYNNKTYFAYSTNGIDWTLSSTIISESSGDVEAIYWDGSKFIKKWLYSYDGFDWAVITAPYNAALGIFIAWSGSIYISGGYKNYDSILSYSYDGINWERLDGLFLGYYGLVRDACWNGQKFIVVAGSERPEFLENTILESSDGIHWVASSGGRVIYNGARAICWGEDKFVAVGASAGPSFGIGHNSIAYSTDGLNWTGAGCTAIKDGHCVCWNGSLFVAGGTPGSVQLEPDGPYYSTSALVYSYDGITWNKATNVPLSSVANIVWNGNVFVAVGRRFSWETSPVAYSYDGINWTSVTAPIFPAQIYTYGQICSKNAPNLYPPTTA